MSRPLVSNNDDVNKARAAKIEQVLKKHPGRVPVMCHKSSNKIHFKLNVSSKLLVPGEYKFGQFAALMRQHAELAPHEALFFFIDQTLIPPQAESLDSLYKKYKAQDGLLHIFYSTESAFG